MAQPIQVELISDDEEDDHNGSNNPLVTPGSNPLKRPRTEFPPISTPFVVIDDDPPPQKLRTFSSSAPFSLSQISSSDSPKPQDPQTSNCKSKDVKDPSSGSSNLPRISDVGGFICLESDDEDEEFPDWRNMGKNIGTFAGFDDGKDLEATSRFGIKDKQWESGEINVEQNSTKKLGFGLKESWSRNEAINADFSVECLDESPRVMKSTCPHENQTSTKTHESIYLEDDADQILTFQVPYHGKENDRLDEEDATCKGKSRGKSNLQLKHNRDGKATNGKKSLEEKTRLMEEKKLKKQQEQLHKAALKTEAAKSKQLEKDKQRWEKECDKNILTEIDPKVLQCGSIGGHLLTRFGEKGLKFNITSNRIENSIVWRMNIPEELSQLSSLGTDVRYVLLVYGAEDFCKVALDGSIMDHISSVRNHYPSYTICCLTNRLMSYINKREQEKYKNQKSASDWQRPPVEEVLAKLTTQFANVHTRQCADEAELADHVVGLTINLAKCRFRKKLTPISVNAYACNLPKDCVNRDLIMKHTWLKMLVAIPKVQPRFAIAVWKKYPTVKSLLSVYMDPTKSVIEKESLLKGLMMEGLFGNEDRRLGEICSKRIYRILMAQNGSITTDEIENGADYFTTNLNRLNC